MSTTLQLSTWRIKSWQIIFLFGILQITITAPCVFFFDYLAGSATAGFGVMGEVPGIGLFYVYMLGYFNTLVVTLPILLIRRFGVGAMIFLPYAIIGFPTEYYFEIILEPVLHGPLAVLGLCLIGIIIGLSADLTFRFLPDSLNERLRAILIGFVMAITTFILMIIALQFFYITAMQTGPGSFIGLAYFGLPWLIITSAFGGYTAWAISIELRGRSMNE